VRVGVGDAVGVALTLRYTVTRSMRCRSGHGVVALGEPGHPPMAVLRMR
jgi:hypothetical protein